MSQESTKRTTTRTTRDDNTATSGRRHGYVGRALKVRDFFRRYRTVDGTAVVVAAVDNDEDDDDDGDDAIFS